MKDRTPIDAGYLLDEYDGPRFWQHVEFHGGKPYLRDPLATASGECRNWNGEIDTEFHGYGRFKFAGAWRQAHRVSYRDFGSRIPDGLEIDHLCRNAKCVNPAHLEPVSHGVNVERGRLGTKTHCVNGHEFTPENVKMQTRRGKQFRACRACRKAWAAKYYQQRKAA